MLLENFHFLSQIVNKKDVTPLNRNPLSLLIDHLDSILELNAAALLPNQK